MTRNYRYKQVFVGNPLANAVVVVVGALILGASLVLGFFAFVALGSILAVLAAIVGIRVWLLRWRLRKQFASGEGSQARAATETHVIEGEYIVISRRRPRPDDD